MPKIEKTVLQHDPSEAESGARKPKTPGQSKENKSFCLDGHSPGRSRILSTHPGVVLDSSYIKGIDCLWLKCL